MASLLTNFRGMRKFSDPSTNAGPETIPGETAIPEKTFIGAGESFLMTVTQADDAGLVVYARGSRRTINRAAA